MDYEDILTVDMIRLKSKSKQEMYLLIATETQIYLPLIKKKTASI